MVLGAVKTPKKDIFNLHKQETHTEGPGRGVLMDFRGPMNSTNIDITVNPPTPPRRPIPHPTTFLLLSCCHLQAARERGCCQRVDSEV